MKQKVTGYCTLVLYQNFQAPKQADQLGVFTNSQDARDRIGEFFINLDYRRRRELRSLRCLPGALEVELFCPASEPYKLSSPSTRWMSLIGDCLP